MKLPNRNIIEHQINRIQNIIDELQRPNIKILLGDQEISKERGGYITINYLSSIRDELIQTTKQPTSPEKN